MVKNNNRIRQLRNKQKMSLPKFSEDLFKKVNLKISPDALSKYERGDREPKLETWQKLADYFGVSVSYLQGIPEKEQNENSFVTALQYLNQVPINKENETTEKARIETIFNFISSVFSEASDGEIERDDITYYLNSSQGIQSSLWRITVLMATQLYSLLNSPEINSPLENYKELNKDLLVRRAFLVGSLEVVLEQMNSFISSNPSGFTSNEVDVKKYIDASDSVLDLLNHFISDLNGILNNLKG